MKKILEVVPFTVVFVLSVPVLFVGLVGEFLKGIADIYIDALEATMNQSKRLFNKF